MASLSDVLVDELLAGQLDILRFEAGTRARVLALLARLQRDLFAQLHGSGAPLTDFSKSRAEMLLRQAAVVIDKYYLAISGEMDVALGASAKVVATQASRSMSMLIQLGASLPTETFLRRIASNTVLLGAPSADWWSRQSLDVAFRFGNAVRQGMVQGETNEQIAARVAGSPLKGTPGIMDVARSNARSLVHTSIQAVANESRLETFRKNSDIIVALRWLATLDSHTCTICAPRDNREYTLVDDPPEPIKHGLKWLGGPGAIHWGCRCVAVPVIAAYAGKGPQGKRAAAGGPVSAKVTFEQFLRRKGAGFAEEVLGKGRAELFRAKKLTLEQLLGDMTSTRLTLKQLQARYA